MSLTPSAAARPYADAVVDYAQAGWPAILPVFSVARPVALYRHFDQRGELLYVGITLDPGQRWEQHRESSLWARFTAGTHLRWYPDRAAARTAEKVAIKAEQPIFNTQRPDAGRAVNDRKIRYLRTGESGLFRRVPCRSVADEFCIACGPDAEAWFDTLADSVALPPPGCSDAHCNSSDDRHWINSHGYIPWSS